MKSKRTSKTQSVSKGGFETDQPLRIGVRYRFVTKEPGMPEVSREGYLIRERDEGYYVLPLANTFFVPLVDVIEVNQVLE